ncbi:unnamed protein product [Lactuca virosa]|uniref:Uncharacterized protein n=1 Tax=Lactuca virosa TaxID=75947 RepID=A0AAU9M245_9ASTR|nr:unnamed protein product [Lactuca virosa]
MAFVPSSLAQSIKRKNRREEETQTTQCMPPVAHPSSEGKRKSEATQVALWGISIARRRGIRFLADRWDGRTNEGRKGDAPPVPNWFVEGEDCLDRKRNRTNAARIIFFYSGSVCEGEGCEGCCSLDSPEEAPSPVGFL